MLEKQGSCQTSFGYAVVKLLARESTTQAVGSAGAGAGGAPGAGA